MGTAWALLAICSRGIAPEESALKRCETIMVNLSLGCRPMSTKDLVLKSLRSDVHYRGNYTENAFELLAAPTPLYRSLLKHLGVFGATFQNFKVETPSLADSHISCSLPDLNTAIRIRLDRFEIDCWRLHEIGTETAHRIVLAGWAAIHEADAAMKVMAHVVDLNILAEVRGGTAADVLRQYVQTPDPLGVMDVGVAFYTRPIQKNEEPWINIVLDRVFREDSQLVIKTTVGCDAAAVPLDSIALAVENQTNRTLDGLGLHFVTDDKK